MSLPDERIESLLHGYLDDALADDERTEFETLLRDDHDQSGVTERLAEMRQLRQVLQQVATANKRVKLGPEFADQVVEAAVTRAREEGLGIDHPLIRVAEQPLSHLPSRDADSWRGRVAWIASIAACLLAVASFAYMRGDSEPIQGKWDLDCTT